MCPKDVCAVYLLYIKTFNNTWSLTKLPLVIFLNERARHSTQLQRSSLPLFVHSCDGDSMILHRAENTTFGIRENAVFFKLFDLERRRTRDTTNTDFGGALLYRFTFSMASFHFFSYSFSASLRLA